MNLRIPADLDDRYGLIDNIPIAERPVVFIGPFEHHSNELPWRESIADVVTIDEDANGHVDVAHLEAELERYAHRPLKIGSFSAASNVTGIITDWDSVAALLHSHGAVSFWDFAAAAPYVKVDMGPLEGTDPLAYKDAVFISPHKMIGGPGTPGVLVARRELFTNTVPAVPGGGTVAYVNPLGHRYVDEIEHREEGGTPAIVESIRAGLVFMVKERIGYDTIREREESFIRRAIASWSQNANIEILGNADAERLSIVSFVLRHGDRYLHHNFAVALLNDLFGIQARGGCSCAGPYGHRLLGIDLDTSREFEREIARGCEGIKPGWVRVNFNYFIDEKVFDFVISAVHLVADLGWRLLPQYGFDAWTALWRHRTAPAAAPLSLFDLKLGPGGFAYSDRRRHEGIDRLGGYIAEARRLMTEAGPASLEPEPTEMGPDFEHLRWFHLPEDLQAELASD